MLLCTQEVCLYEHDMPFAPATKGQEGLPGNTGSWLSGWKSEKTSSTSYSSKYKSSPESYPDAMTCLYRSDRRVNTHAESKMLDHWKSYYMQSSAD